jgi:formate dehydrogenase subunit delta
MSTAHLKKMANQIARNQSLLGDPEDTAQRVADHITRFWAPSMRQELAEQATSEEGENLTAVVKTALQIMQDG